MSAMKTTRYLVFRSKASPTHLCVCAARDRRHAVTIARQMFRLPATAYAIPEQPLRQEVQA